MRGSSFSVCMHILTLLSHFKSEYLSSDFIARSINMNPVMVRKELLKLKESRLVESKEGKSGGSRIALPAESITLKDIFLAVREPNQHTLALYKNDPNTHCPIGAQIQEKLETLYDTIDQEIMNRLEKITLQDFHQQFV